MATNRETIRDAVKDLLTTALVGTGLPVKTVTNSKVKTLSGLTPLVAVLPDGTTRTTQPIDSPIFHLRVQVWVEQERTGWTTAQAMDAIDRIESLITAAYEGSRGTTNWSMLVYDGRSTVEEITSGGKLYYVETIPTAVYTTKA